VFPQTTRYLSISLICSSVCVLTERNAIPTNKMVCGDTDHGEVRGKEEPSKSFKPLITFFIVVSKLFLALHSNFIVHQNQ